MFVSAIFQAMMDLLRSVNRGFEPICRLNCSFTYFRDRSTPFPGTALTGLRIGVILQG